MDSRKEIALKIVNNPDGYKVCEGCDSIVVVSTQICPNCHGYRYDITEESVVEQAHILGDREQTSVTAEDLSE